MDEAKIERIIRDSERLRAVLSYIKSSTYIEKDVLLSLIGEGENK